VSPLAGWDPWHNFADGLRGDCSPGDWHGVRGEHSGGDPGPEVGLEGQKGGSLPYGRIFFFLATLLVTNEAVSSLPLDVHLPSHKLNRGEMESPGSHGDRMGSN
jgi:hypothetical protein